MIRHCRRLTPAILATLLAFALFSYGDSPVGPSPVAAASLVVNTLGDGAPNDDSDCTLREAILNANANVVTYDECGSAAGPTVDTITFSVSGIILLTAGELSVTDPNLLTIDGGGLITVSGNNATRVFNVSASLSLVALAVIDGNAAFSLGFGEGGGIFIDNGSLTLTNSTVSSNEAFTGGGIYNYFGTLTLANSVVNGNSASSTGGGIFTFGDALLTDSTVSNNISGSFGGGISNVASLIVVNSTISGNSSPSVGGGISNLGELTLINSTVTDNSAPTVGGGGIWSAAAVALSNTIVAAQASGPDCTGLITSGGNNLDSDGTCVDGSVNGDIPEGDANLGPLQDNGGPTETHALLPGSDAIDAGNDTVCEAPLPAGAGGIDQRGVIRPQDGDGDDTAICDIGAFELEGEDVGGEDPDPDPDGPEPLNLTITKSCLSGDDGDADFNILVTQLEDVIAADALDCGEVMIVEGVSGLVTISELITGPNANDFVTAIICTTAAGQTVTPGSLAQVNIEVDTACQIVNAFQDPGDPAAPGDPAPCNCAPAVIVPIDIENTNDNALNNDNLNTNNNENTNKQEQSNFQEQTNDNNQTTTGNSSPSVVIDFD